MTLFWLEFELIRIGDFSFTLARLLSFFLIIIVTFVASKIVQRGLKRLYGRGAAMTGAQLYALGRILHYFILAAGFLMAVSALGVNVSKLTILAGALGVGIGLGLQNIVNNFVSGLVILLERSLKVGDFIELSAGVVGEVLEINMRSTLIRTNDNVDILVPNAELIGGMVTNWTLEENIRRFRIPFGVAYGSDKSLVKKAVLEAAISVPYTLSKKGREPIVWMTGFGDNSLNFVLGVWVSPEQVKAPTTLTSDYLWAIDDAFHKYKIEIPFPQRDIHLRSGFDTISARNPEA
ncbi:mechanosensitive ion channel family protein [Teredinibacter haidensis]|uniref:mechanosensitive ion channel family protein n=1 Tax=Teredinibacter haidensis TaxID=2731755 RepID=UPI000948C229|nr:mechanosensitive ion channel domain-containing protein [Teredinibacter haidensis]